MTYGTCRHCSYHTSLLGRHLCWRCFRNRDIRKQYPKGHRHRPTATEPEHEPTEEELEATIAEQSANLPEWWAIDEEEMRRQASAERLEWYRIRLMLWRAIR